MAQDILTQIFLSVAKAVTDETGQRSSNEWKELTSRPFLSE